MSDWVRIFSGEHGAYWRPDGDGYTEHIGEAWVLPREEAIKHTQHCGPEKMIELRPVSDPDVPPENIHEFVLHDEDRKEAKPKVPLFIAELVETFKAMGATNYLSIGLDSPDIGPLELTIQRRHGKTAAQLKDEAESRVKSLSQQLADELVDRQRAQKRITTLEAERDQLRVALRKIENLPNVWQIAADAANEAVEIARAALAAAKEQGNA